MALFSITDVPFLNELNRMHACLNEERWSSKGVQGRGLGSDGQGWKPGTIMYCCRNARPVTQPPSGLHFFNCPMRVMRLFPRVVVKIK